jgi:hypothetical protein
MPNQPKPGNIPLSFRPGVYPGDPEGDREWLKQRAEQTNQAVGAIVSAAVRAYRKTVETSKTEEQ